MSYQPQPPIGTAPAQFGPAPAPAANKGGVLRLLAVVVLLAGIGGGVFLYLQSSSTKEETVKKFARAPVGCTTTLEFDRRGTFTVYAESRGSIGDVGGDCEANDGTFRSDGTDPDVSFNLVDDGDEEVDFDEVAGASYDVGGYAGREIATIDVPSGGTYRITVTGDDGAAIAIGGDPEGNSSTLLGGAILAAAAGVVLALVLFVIARRRGSAPAPMVPVVAPGGVQWHGQVVPPAPGAPGAPWQAPPQFPPQPQPMSPPQPTTPPRPRIPTKPPEWGSPPQ